MVLIKVESKLFSDQVARHVIGGDIFWIIWVLTVVLKLR